MSHDVKIKKWNKYSLRVELNFCYQKLYLVSSSVLPIYKCTRINLKIKSHPFNFNSNKMRQPCRLPPPYIDVKNQFSGCWKSWKQIKTKVIQTMEIIQLLICFYILFCHRSTIIKQTKISNLNAISNSYYSNRMEKWGEKLFLLSPNYGHPFFIYFSFLLSLQVYERFT